MPSRAAASSKMRCTSSWLRRCRCAQKPSPSFFNAAWYRSFLIQCSSGSLVWNSSQWRRLGVVRKTRLPELHQPGNEVELRGAIADVGDHRRRDHHVGLLLEIARWPRNHVEAGKDRREVIDVFCGGRVDVGAVREQPRNVAVAVGGRRIRCRPMVEHDFSFKSAHRVAQPLVGLPANAQRRTPRNAKERVRTHTVDALPLDGHGKVFSEANPMPACSLA